MSSNSWQKHIKSHCDTTSEVVG